MSRTSSRRFRNEFAESRGVNLPCLGFLQEFKALRGCPEVLEVKTSEVLRFERYLTFHCAEILEELNRNDECDSDPESTWSAKWGSSANVLRECLLRTREDINSALARIREGTYGNCVGCGNEIDSRQLEVVPWSKFCIACQEESEQQPAENRSFDRSRLSNTQSPNPSENRPLLRRKT